MAKFASEQHFVNSGVAMNESFKSLICLFQIDHVCISTKNIIKLDKIMWLNNVV